MTPNGKAHEALMRKVYRDVGLNSRETAFVDVSTYEYQKDLRDLANVPASATEQVVLLGTS